jgi:hypothetical protein
LQEQWVIPSQQNADFVAAMEDVLEVDQRPYDPLRPQVWLDKTRKPLTRKVRTPVPAAPGRPARVDSDYERNGRANLFMMFEPCGAGVTPR